MKTRKLLSAFALATLATSVWAEEFTVRSPDDRLAMTLETGDRLTIAIEFDGATVLSPSEIGMRVNGNTRIGGSGVPTAEERTSVDQIVEPVVQRKKAQLREHYHRLLLTFDGGYCVEMRAYDDGVAYRFLTDLDGEMRVNEETMDLRFPEGSRSFFPEEESMISHNERLYPLVPLSELDEERFASLPLMVEVPNAASVVFSEADLYSYPAMYVKGGDAGTLSAKFPNFVLETKPAADGPDRNVEIVKEADYIARTEGERSLPWRVFVVGEDDTTFLESELVYLLSRPLKLEDTDWIKPGRVAWDWYNANNIYGVDFESGINNDTYKYYIDFASEFGIEYVILDEGWSVSTTNVFEPNPEIDVPELVAYGRERDVEIILWSLWGPMDEDAGALFDLYRDWGVAGVKIDFMQRSDQYMVEYYERIAREAAKRELLVDYHGSFKPAGLRRAYPNVISYEGVKGNENNKWSADITPRHNVTIPFIRMVAGPMDYTPGAISNANPRSHAINHFRPMGLGTRAHEVAKYAVYESALQMYCDSPSSYLKELETTQYITRFPSVWDDTVALDGKVSDYVLVARRSGTTWFVGAMTDENARSLDVDLSFLGDGAYRAEIYQDGANAHNFAEDYKIVEKTVKKGDTLTADMAPGGGWSAILTKK